MEPVAIILPCRNSIKCIEPALKSILFNTVYPFKLIIIESESTDGTAQLVDKYADDFDEVEVYHTKAEGLVKAINYGIKKAGDLDIYLTQDDVIIPKLYGRDWLTEIMKVKKFNKNVGMITTIRGGGISGDLYIDGLCWVGTWSCFIPRDTIKKVGLFDESLGPGDDIDYSYRVYQTGLYVFEADFWVDHHRRTEHSDVDSESTVNKMAEVFRKKWKIGEFK